MTWCTCLTTALNPRSVDEFRRKLARTQPSVDGNTSASDAERQTFHTTVSPSIGVVMTKGSSTGLCSVGMRYTWMRWFRRIESNNDAGLSGPCWSGLPRRSVHFAANQNMISAAFTVGLLFASHSDPHHDHSASLRWTHQQQLPHSTSSGSACFATGWSSRQCLAARHGSFWCFPKTEVAVTMVRPRIGGSKSSTLENEPQGKVSVDRAADVAEVHRQVSIALRDSHYLGCQVRTVGAVFVNTVGAFGGIRVVLLLDRTSHTPLRRALTKLAPACGRRLPLGDGRR